MALRPCRGDGQDTIVESGPNYYGDTLNFGADIAASDVSAVRSGSDLIFKLANSSDQITVKNWFNNSSGYNQIEQVKFADGTTWSSAQVNAQALEVFGTDANDVLHRRECLCRRAARRCRQRHARRRCG